MAVVVAVVLAALVVADAGGSSKDDRHSNDSLNSLSLDLCFNQLTRDYYVSV